MLRIGIDADKAEDFDGVAGFFLDFADDGLVGALADFDCAAGEGPFAVVGAAVEEEAAVVVEDDGTNRRAAEAD